MVSFSMHDDQILTQDQIESRCREVEYHLRRIEGLEKTLGPLRVDGESVRLALKDIRRDYCTPRE